MIVYLPILTLQGIEGKLFRPMALTVIFALLGSMVLSLTLMPVLVSLLLPRKIAEREPLIMRIAHRIHAPILRFAMRQKFLVISIGICLLVVAIGPRILSFGLIKSDFGIAPSLGSEFVPTLSEGAVAINVVRLAGTDLDVSVEENTKMEQVIVRAFPEVRHIWSRIGVAEIATDPMGVELTDMFMSLKPRRQWPEARAKALAKARREGNAEVVRLLEERPAATSQAELTDQIEKELRDMVGPRLGFTQPIKLRMDEMVSGVRADLAVKVFGDDLDKLTELGLQVESVLKKIRGSSDINVEQLTGQPLLQIKVKQKELARYGLAAKTVMDLVESIGSLSLGEIVEGEFRFPLIARLAEDARANRDAIANMLVATPKGERIPLEKLADVEILKNSPSTITRERGKRRIVVTANVKDRDLGSFVAEVQEKVKEIAMPSVMYHVEFGGQFEHLISANRRFLIVIPIVIVLIVTLLYFTYRNWVDALRVLMGVPFAAVGGLVALWLRDMPISISAIIGFIAMSGVAVLDDMILVSYIRQLRKKGMPLDEAVQKAAITRLRPVLMTTLVASLGFLPMAFSTGVGAEVQRPLATVVIGGVVGAMVTSLFIIRVLYVVFQSPLQQNGTEGQSGTAAVDTANGGVSD
jgi:heavy metal efflux system protein